MWREVVMKVEVDTEDSVDLLGLRMAEYIPSSLKQHFGENKVRAGIVWINGEQQYHVPDVEALIATIFKT